MVKLNFAIMNIRAKTRFVFTVDVAKECFCKAIAIRIDKLQDWRYNNSAIIIALSIMTLLQNVRWKHGK